ncbi:hypothetical protein AWC38_SpisGene8655 [Stylophora pistillata]|uniref:DUF5641 domain-containing protein n=1 Tax=Stylophora pistillata TaxID=50429 RepID=A0A2B4SD10_STYPI|nr:hypothetical protein AWC38_SpisGene8655 [Stylophora pistillata]
MSVICTGIAPEGGNGTTENPADQTGGLDGCQAGGVGHGQLASVGVGAGCGQMAGVGGAAIGNGSQAYSAGHGYGQMARVWKVQQLTLRQIEYLRRRGVFKGVVTKNSKKAKDNISKNGSKTVLRTVKERILRALQDASKTTEDIIALQSDDVTKRAETEEWLDNLQDEVEDIVDSIEEYLESCADESSRASEESSVAIDVVSEVDEKRKGTHHFPLHFKRRSNPPERVDAAVETRNAFGDSEFTGDVVLRTVPVWLIGSEGQRIQVNAILDDRSDSTYVREDIATALGLEAKEQTLRLATLTDSCIPLTGKEVPLTIKSINGETQAIVEAWTLNEMCQGLSIPDWNQHNVKWEHLKNIPFPKAPGRKTIDILIGSDHPEPTPALRECYGPIGTPVARKTPLGWTCVGRLPTFRSAKRITYTRTFRIQNLYEVCLYEQLREMWEIDSLGVRNSDDNQLNQEEILAMSKVEKSRRWTGDRYEVAIPWKEETPSLPDNREEAEKRLLCLEKTLLKKPEVASCYYDVMNTNVQKGYIRKLEPNEAEDGPSWNLPHFPIVREDKDTTKVLLRFRLGPVTLVADIKDMFSQIVLAEKDRKYHRLLWRDLDPAKPMDVYEAVRLTFGDRASPYHAQFVICSHALDFKEDHPATAIVLLRDMYMDNILHSEETVEDAVLFREDLIKLSTHRWAEQLPEASQVKIPCYYRHHEEAVENVSLHTFVDGSRLAYAAVSYIRYRHMNGEISVALVTAKARVTPIKLVSVSHLELMAAVLGVRLAETVSEKLEIPIIQHTLWTDSMDVIYWIQGHSRRLKPFVANRVAEIQRKTDPAQWQHVPGDQNPADDATRGLDLRNLFVGSHWFKGPAFLQEGETSWPLESHPLSNDCSKESKRELTKLNLTFQSKKILPLFDIERFSSWRQLSGVTAWILRFISKSKRARLQKGQKTGNEQSDPLGKHHGGIFEALIKSAKKALRAILGESRTMDEELLTTVVEVEGILNSRLLSYCSNDPDDENVLTPNHFFYGQMGGQLAPKVADEIVFNPRNRWRFVQDLINKCWKRLMKEYLSTLNTRNIWVEEKRNLVLGDVVLVVDPGNLRGHWPLGRIQEAFPGPDGKVRVVRVRTGGKDYV